MNMDFHHLSLEFLLKLMIFESGRVHRRHCETSKNYQIMAQLKPNYPNLLKFRVQPDSTEFYVEQWLKVNANGKLCCESTRRREPVRHFDEHKKYFYLLKSQRDT